MMTIFEKSVIWTAMPYRDRLKIYFDGGCRPNPGRMETAVVARGVTCHRADCGYGTNNDAEWLALIHAAEIALASGARDILLLGDSAFAIGQAGHKPDFLALRSQLDRVIIRRISRHQNLAGIALARAHCN
jgi:ribonuclease HI